MKKKIAIVGCGKLGNVVAGALLDGYLPEYQLTGAYSRSFEKAESLSDLFPDACRPCRTVGELLNLRPDFIIEAASPAAMREIAIPALERGISIITLSIGAFADDDFYENVREAASNSDSKVYIASGATGGFDVLRTASLMGGARAEFYNEKGPDALKGTPVYDESLQTERRTVFEGTAKEAITMFPVAQPKSPHGRSYVFSVILSAR